MRTHERQRVVDADLLIDGAEAWHGGIGGAVALGRIGKAREALEPTRHRPLDQHAGAIAHPHRHLVARAPLHAELAKQAVDRHEDVLDGVDERAVEIEEHRIGRNELHGGNG